MDSKQYDRLDRLIGHYDRLSVLVSLGIFGRRNLRLFSRLRGRHFARQLQVAPVVLLIHVAARQCLPGADWHLGRLAGVDAPRPNLVDGQPISRTVKLAATLLAMPVIVQTEERLFRKGINSPIDGAVRTIAFGAMHLLFDRTVADAVAVSVGGGFLLRTYRRHGFDEAVLCHVAQDTMGVGLLLLLRSVKHVADYAKRPVLRAEH